MEHIYFALVDTPGFFAYFIRKVIGQDYIHVVLSLDEQLSEAYSIGRRNPAVPFFAGFEKEDKKKILDCFPEARYMVCELSCSSEQKERIKNSLTELMERRFSYHYAVIGLPFVWLQIPFYQKNHYTCSSFVAKILSENGIAVSDKHFSIVTPRDFYEFTDKKVIFEGSLQELVDQKEDTRNAWPVPDRLGFFYQLKQGIVKMISGGTGMHYGC